jgi:hypothetical protein
MNSTSMPGASAVYVRGPFETIDLFVCHIPPNVREQLPAFIVRTDRVVPVGLEGDVLVVAMEDPDDHSLHRKIRFVTDRELRIVIAMSTGIDHLIETYFAAEDEDDDA